jgi:hypothetical protein
MHDFVIAYPFAIIGHTLLRSGGNKGKRVSVHPNGCVRQVRDLFSMVASDQNLNDKYMLKESRNRPGVAQRVPGDLGSQIS